MMTSRIALFLIAFGPFTATCSEHSSAFLSRRGLQDDVEAGIENIDLLDDKKGVVPREMKKVEVSGVPFFLRVWDNDDDDDNDIAVSSSSFAFASKEWIVILKPDVVDDVDALLSEMCEGSLTKWTCQGRGGSDGIPYATIVTDDIAEFASEYANFIDFIEEDGDSELIDIDDAAIEDVGVDDNDTASMVQNVVWGLDRIDSRSGLDQSYSPTGDGAGVHVYVVDTGIRTTHVDFGGRAIPTLDATVGGSRGYVECEPTNTSCAADGHGHGTHCAGTVAGTIGGVAKRATVHAVKIFKDNGESQNSWITAALNWISINAVKPAVVSMSFGAATRSPIFERGLARIAEKGITMVSSSGNNNGDACAMAPGSSPYTINVGGTDRNDDRYFLAADDGSNFGRCVDILAPAVRVQSAGVATDRQATIMTGTSMACPHVAGAAALLLGRNPGLSGADVKTMLLSAASTDEIANLEDGTPNRFLYVGENSLCRDTGYPFMTQYASHDQTRCFATERLADGRDASHSCSEWCCRQEPCSASSCQVQWCIDEDTVGNHLCKDERYPYMTKYSFHNKARCFATERLADGRDDSHYCTEWCCRKGETCTATSCQVQQCIED